MKRICFALFCIATLCSCGSASKVSVASDDDTVDMGYMKVRKSDNTSPASVVKISEMAAHYDNIFDYLRGQVPGLYIGPAVDGGGQPEMRIRGVKSINADLTPLILVDGSEMTNIGNLDPNIVDRVTVLKGPETAIYGARGSNGVILIKTRTALDWQ